MNNVLSLFWIAVIILGLGVQPAGGQTGISSGEGKYFYIRLAPGLSAYRGNLSSINNDKSFLGFAVKAGAGYVMTREISIGFDYRIADYPRTKRPSIGNYTHNHTANIFANYVFLRFEDVESYILGGIGMTFFGLYDDPHKFKPAFSPTFGGGISLRIDPRFTLFAEAKIDLILDDEAMDERTGSRGIDAIGFFGLGVKMNMFPR